MNRKLLFICLVLCSLLLVVAGCSIASASAEIQNLTPTAKVTGAETVTVTLASTPTPSVTPTPSPMPTPEVLTTEQLLAEAPEIAGLSKEIEDEKVVYKAVEGNEYGIEAGKWAGEYNKNIVMEGEDFGNISLIPVVAEHVLNDQLNEIPNGERELKVLLPMDSTRAGENKINISFEKDEMDNNITIVNCDSTIDVLNNIPNSKTFYIFWISQNGIDLMFPLSIDGTFGDSGVATNETMMNFLQTGVSGGNFDKSKDGATVEIPYGSIIGNNDGKKIILSCADSDNTYSIDSSTFVKIENAFVSMTSER